MADKHPMLHAMHNSASMKNSTSSSKVSNGSKSGQSDPSSKRPNGEGSSTELVRRHSSKKKRAKSSKTSGALSSIDLTMGSTPLSAPLSVPSTMDTPVQQIWVPGGLGSVGDPSESVVTGYVSKILFHMVKFITNRDIQLAYNATDRTSICYNTLVGCRCTMTNIDRTDWWNTKGSRYVHESLTGLRNNKATTLKWVFFCKREKTTILFVAITLTFY